MKIISVVGARPNFIKIAPFIKVIKQHNNINHILVHTGQHFDDNMSSIFFNQMNLPKPKYNLDISGGVTWRANRKDVYWFIKNNGNDNQQLFN